MNAFLHHRNTHLPSFTSFLLTTMSDKTTQPSSSMSAHYESHEDGEETPLMQLLSVSTTVLTQAQDLVENVLTSDDQLQVHSKYLPGSTIGGYTLQLLDHQPHLLIRSTQVNTSVMLETTSFYCSTQSPLPHRMNYHTILECGIPQWKLVW